MNLLIGSNVYRPLFFHLEEDFEAIVLDLSDKIFGEQTIYIDVKKKLKGNEFSIIPDGYLIDMTVPTSPKLYLIENEIVEHDPFRHIGIQLLKFSINFEDSRNLIKNMLMKYILANEAMKKRLEQGCKLSDARNIDAYLDRAVYDDFKAIIVIDEARPELYKVLEKINANISVLELKIFKHENQMVFQFDTLYDGDRDIIEPEITVETDDEYKKQLSRKANCDTIIVPALEEGFEKVFLEQSQWYSIRIGAAMKERIKYIAAYQVAPDSAVNYIAEVSEIKPYMNTGKYVVIFKRPAEKLAKKIKLRESKNAPRGPVYVKRDNLMKAEFLEDALHGD